MGALFQDGLTDWPWSVSLWREDLVGARIHSWKRAAVQNGLEHGSRRICIVRDRYQETSSEDTVSWRFVKCVEISDGSMIKWNYELCVKVVGKSNIEFKNSVASHSYAWQYLNGP
jgi:hypothetical protein